MVNSVWAGYLESAKNQWFAKWMKDREIPLHLIHTSGHASISDLKRLRNAFPRAVAVPVHLEDPERIYEPI